MNVVGIQEKILGIHDGQKQYKEASDYIIEIN